MLIGVHDGTFHADDVFAVATLLLLHPDAKIVRTRDASTLAECDIRVDVGRKYNGTTDFDHHQKEGSGVRDNGVPYASFGLVWKHFGEQLCSLKAVSEIDSHLVQYIDGPDCGYSMDVPKEGLGRYGLHETVKSFLPAWNDEQSSFDDAFTLAVGFAQGLLSREIHKVEAKLIGQQK